MSWLPWFNFPSFGIGVFIGLIFGVVIMALMSIAGENAVEVTDDDL